MKIVSILASFVLLLLPVVGASSVSTRELHQNSTVLSNGAELSVDIITPKNGTRTDVNDKGVIVQGTVHVGKAVPDVTYIYIIDSSGSTEEADGNCGSILQCTQAFFEKLHNEIKSDGSAKLIAVIDFDSYAYVTADLQEPSSSGEIQDAINAGFSDGGTACSAALREAARLVLDPRNTALATVVIFAGDGLCDGSMSTSWDQALPEAAGELEATGAIVHSIAVGDNVDCDPDQGSLAHIPSNGGACISIPDPSTLHHIIDEVKIGTTLKNIELRVDGVAMPSAAFTVSEELPQVGLTDIEFETTVTGLKEGDHEICIVAIGQNLLRDDHPDDVEDCHIVHARHPTTLLMGGPTSPIGNQNQAALNTPTDPIGNQNQATPNPKLEGGLPPDHSEKASTADTEDGVDTVLMIVLAAAAVIAAALLLTLFVMYYPTTKPTVNNDVSFDETDADAEAAVLPPRDPYPLSYNAPEQRGGAAPGMPRPKLF